MSVIIPVYRHVQYAYEAIQSVLGQTVDAFEIIIVDDGSPEDTSVLATLDPQRTRLIHQPNRERGAARNHGPHEAKGEYVAFLDADDLWIPTKLALDFRVIEKYPQAGLVHSRVWLGNVDGKLFSRPIPWHPPPSGWVLEALAVETSIAICSVIARRDAVIQAGAFYEDPDPCTEDWELWIRIAQKNEIIFHPAPTAIYRQSIRGTLLNASRMGVASFRTIDRTFSLPSLADRSDLRRTGRVCAFASQFFGMVWDSGERAGASCIRPLARNRLSSVNRVCC